MSSAQPRLLAMGVNGGRVYQHVGYVVGGHDAFRVAPARPYLAPALGLAGGLLLVGALLWPRAGRARRLAVSLSAAIVLLCAVYANGQRCYAMRPGTLEGLQQIERLAASTEAQAVALGRWPTQREWHRIHGYPTGRDGQPVHYQVGGPPPAAWHEPGDRLWQTVGIWCGPDSLGEQRGQPVWLDSRLFGADGLFGTSDDDSQIYFLRPVFYERRDWPHGRAPRDPAVELPPLPRNADDAHEHPIAEQGIGP